MTPLRSLGLFVFIAATVGLVLSPLFAPPVRGASVFGDPIVVVYPLTFAGAVQGEAGSDVSLVIAQKLAEGGGLKLKPPIPGTERAQYLAAAVSQRADYYVTGFLQTIGQDVSMIVQVVSTHSGSVVFSTTSTIRIVGDAAVQADALRVAILRHAGRGYAALDAPATVTNAEPSTMPTNGPGVNLTKALRKHQRATPAPSPSAASEAGLTPVSEIERVAPSASPAAKAAVIAQAAVVPAPTPTPTQSPTQSPTVAPSAMSRASGILVIDASGSESADVLAAASDSLVNALHNAHVRVARLPIGADNLRKNAASICAANSGTARFYAPALVMGRDDASQIVARLSVASIDCNGSTVATRTSSGFANVRNGSGFAIDHATAKLVPLLAGI